MMTKEVRVSGQLTGGGSVEAVTQNPQHVPLSLERTDNMFIVNRGQPFQVLIYELTAPPYTRDKGLVNIW